ncbi:MAG: phosphate ABC transporter permease PstA, partial [Elusimicrobia bacterium]|nr:phosphate ABC transporter permease PstA [Elusimicrobiota bacterium]
MITDSNFERRQVVGKLFFAWTGACALIACSLLFLILGYIAWQGASSLDLSFFTRLPKPVGEKGGGIANAILGSAKVVGLAAALGLPVGVAGGLYLGENRKGRMAFWVRYAADVLNGIPSIIIGLVAYTLVVQPMKHFSGLAGSVALAIIMIPIALRNTEEFIRLVPDTLREAGLALGLPRWKVTLLIVLPSAAKGILTGCLLAVSRVAGETAPLIFTAFGNRYWGEGMLQPVATLPHTI